MSLHKKVKQNTNEASTANDRADFHNANTATMAEKNLIKNKIMKPKVNSKIRIYDRIKIVLFFFL